MGEDIEKGEVEGNVRREHDKNRMYAIISFLYLPPSPLTSSPSLPHVLPFPPHILPFLSSHPPLPPLTSSPSPPHIFPFPSSHPSPSVSVNLLLSKVSQQPHGPFLRSPLVVYLPLLGNTLATNLTFLERGGGGRERGEV